MTVVPDEPVMVLDVIDGLSVVLAGTGTTEVPSVPVTVLEVIDTGAVPVDAATPVVAVSVAVKSVVLVSDPTEGTRVLTTESVAAAEDALSVVKWLERPEFKEEAALDKMLENPEARDWVTAASVAVAATLDKSELSEEARLDRAEDAAAVIEPVVVAVGLPLASDSTDDWAEETALANSEAAEDTTPEAPVVADAVSEEVPAVSSVPVGVGSGIGRRPPVLRMGVDDSVPFVVSAASAELVLEPSNSDATEPIRPGVPVPALEPVVNVLLATPAGEVGGTTVPFSVSGAVADNEIGIEAFSELVVASVRDAEEVVVAVPSMMVDRPTVIAPRDRELEMPVSLELPSEELVPVGAGSKIGARPVEPRPKRPPSDAERVEMMAVESAVGEGSSAGRRPPDVPTKGPSVLVLE